ncbi:helix-turn-helix domain-containing protein [Streptomyces sp. NPDC053079]|uniref:helix-turn-helix domain-containing protein n=1 Tax=Streptomyces sp. NPDC053079 TaxID=3365697 RepID=UPI0037D9588A
MSPATMTTTAPGPDAAPVSRDTAHATLGLLRVCTARGPASVVAPASLIPPSGGTADDTETAATNADRIIAAVHGRGVATFVQHGELLACGPHDLVVLDSAVPFAFQEAEDFELHLFGVPRQLLGPDRADVERLCRLHPHTRGDVAPLLSPLLRDLAATATVRSPRSAEHLAGCVVALLRTLAFEAGPAGTPDAPATSPDGRDRHSLAPRLRAYVNENLGDRGLTPESIAAHHHISTRFLHRIFAAEGTTVGRWIQQRRLEECHRELAHARSGRPGAAVATVAKRWGVANPAYFSRTFRAAYGMSPTAWRDSHAASLWPPEA